MFRNIRRLRIERGLSQRQLAEIAGITQQTVNNYEMNRARPGYEILIRLAGYFGVSLDYLILGDDTADHRKDPPGGCDDYTREDMIRHRELFDALPASHKRAVDQLILFLYAPER